MRFLLNEYFFTLAVLVVIVFSNAFQRGAWALTNVTIYIEPYVVEADEAVVSSVTLWCDYDLEKETLYSVKWYIGYVEFYRYMPLEYSPKRIFPYKGIHVDLQSSDAHRVTLRNVHLRLSKTFTCEVSTDFPFYSLVTVSKYIALEGELAPINVTIDIEPPALKSGEDALLKCNYDLGGKQLYSVKWYRDSVEFYRYTPNEVPNIKVFPFAELQVNLLLSGAHTVALQSASVNSSGNFTCEVTVNNPYLNPAVASKYISVEDAPAFGNVTIDIEVEPSVIRSGGDALLQCNYDLKGRLLYSVKWYRGSREFYRFSPYDLPSTKVFPFPGLKINFQLSDENSVFLRNVSSSLAGNFTCEVTADDSSFLTLIATKYLSVIECEEDEVFGNCIAPKFCEFTCSNFNEPVLLCDGKSCATGCACKVGYVRNNEGKCVHTTEC